jgi:hypothetical protein
LVQRGPKSCSRVSGPEIISHSGTSARHEQVESCKRPAGLLHAATWSEPAEVDHCEAKTLDQRLDGDLGLGVVT